MSEENSDPIPVEDLEQAPKQRRIRLPGMKPPLRKPLSRLQQKKTKDPAPVPKAPENAPSLKNVPTTLEGILTMDGEQKSPHQVLGILVEADIKEADAILGRTFLKKWDVVTVVNSLDIARQGMGGSFAKPLLFVSQWVLSFLRALPSIDGKSRSEFVKAWNSQQEARNFEKEMARRRQELAGN